RRRHTRSKRDWSSDVCSSDLPEALHRAEGVGDTAAGHQHHVMWQMSGRGIPYSFRTMEGFGVHTFRMVDAVASSGTSPGWCCPQIGRASCRDGAVVSVWAGAI